MKSIDQKNSHLLEIKSILGSDFFGPTEIEKTFKIKISEKQIPKVLFSIDELRNAKNNNQFLILRINRENNGELLTIEKMNSLLLGKLNDGSFALFRGYDESGMRNNNAWYMHEDFATKEAPALSWALVSKDLASKLVSNSIKPVEIIYDYLIYFDNTGKKLFNDIDILTSQIHPNGMPIIISDFPKEDGLHIGVSDPANTSPRLVSYISITA
jgi:hypothetical protein